MTNIMIKGDSRVFLIEDRAGPVSVPEYMDMAYAGSVSKPFGSTTRIEIPSQTKRRGYTAKDKYRSGEDNASLPITIRYAGTLSDVLKTARKGCPIDIQVHFGQCTDPRDFAAGWHTGKILVFEDADINDYSTTDLGSMSSGDEGEIDESIEISALEFYEIAPMVVAERAKTEVEQEIISVNVCDSIECGDCDSPSDGCQRVFAVSAPAGSSPGLLPEVLVSIDGLSTIAQESPITTLTPAEDPDDAACVGAYYVVVSEDSGSLHYALLEELALGTEAWVEVATGFVAGGEPRAIFNADSPFDTWIAGAGGYIYKCTDPTAGVVVQDAGSATTEDLDDIYFYDLENGVAVGENNAVVYTTNGGQTWVGIDGPDTVGTPDLHCVAMRTRSEWWVGAVGGILYYTTDSGTTWAEKAFFGDGSGVVEDIEWASETVGFMAHNGVHIALGNRGYLLRTITGGYEWTRLPDGTAALIANDAINSIDVCEEEVNILYAGGLADNAADGILLKGSA